jgi:zinc protease
MTQRFSFPQMKEFKLANGLNVILIPENRQEGVVAALQMPFGRFADKRMYEGCAELCLGWMQKGTEELSFEEFSDLFEQHGATIFSEVGEEHTMVGVKMLSRFKEKLFSHFWDMITRPRFESRELTRIQQEMITALRAEAADPGTIANRHFFNELAGSGHPAGRFHTVQSFKKIDASQVKLFYDEQVIPRDSILIIAGDISYEWFEAECRKMVEKWTSIRARIPCEALPAETRTSSIRFIEKNDLTQVSLLIGQSAPGELDPLRNKIALANYVFGAGNFSSRLMTRIRSSAGKTYGVASHIAAERRFGAISIATSTQNRFLEEVVSSILREYKLFCKEGITQAELDKAKRFAIGNMAFQLEGLTNIVEKLLWLRYYKRKNSYIETFDQMIEAITLMEVNEAIRNTFDPGKLIMVAVGKKTEIFQQLSTFGTPERYHFKEKIS